MESKIEELKKLAEEKIKNIQNSQELQDLKVQLLGKKSEISNLLKGLGALSPEERPKELTPVVSEPEKISINAQLILKKYFSQCDHTINKYTEMPEECINMTKEELQEQYPDWEVIGFEPNKVTLYKEFDDTCGEHFKLKIEDGKINIYLINKDGTESLYEKTNISSEYLTETDLININEEGLEIYGKEELNKTIEDFE